MRIIIKNLGPVESIDWDLSSPMTIFTGLNGTGKTYMSYLVYGFYNIAAVTKMNLLGLDALENGREYRGVLDAQHVYKAYVECLENLQNSLYYIYNGSKADYKDARIEPMPCQEFEDELKQMGLDCGFSHFFSLEKPAGSLEYILSVKYLYKESGSVLQTLNYVLLRGILTAGSYQAKMMLAERSGIYAFSKELAQNRLRMPNAPLDENRITRYPYPIREALVEAEDWADKKKKSSPYAWLADEIEQRILHGRVSVSDDGEIRFKGENMVQDVSYVLASASVKTVAGLILYLRYEAEEGSLLIMDEPEANVHPNNQVLMARIFVKMVNAGLRVLINTHSDHIVREINNMIMLSSLPEGEDVAQYGGYEADEVLRKESVKAYYFDFGKQSPHKVKVENLEIADTGFDVRSIDDTIEQLNERAANLYAVIADK